MLTLPILKSGLDTGKCKSLLCSKISVFVFVLITGEVPEVVVELSAGELDAELDLAAAGVEGASGAEGAACAESAKGTADYSYNIP